LAIGLQYVDVGALSVRLLQLQCVPLCAAVIETDCTSTVMGLGEQPEEEEAKTEFRSVSM
jgi:hypothetical protein